jgi:hypothetical protein
MLKKSLILLTLLPVLIALGCNDNGSIHNVTVQKPTQTPEEMVIENCYVIRRAVWAFADENNGEYPRGIMDKSLAGNTVIDLLPGGKRLQNPYTLGRTVPQDYAAVFPGQTGYRRPYPSWTGPPTVGYVINGVGESKDIIVLAKNYPDSIAALEFAVVANCQVLLQAVEAFAAENNGVYAANVDVDTTPSGKTIIDFLPGGLLLENPFYNIRTEPRNGAAAIPGETGYVPVVQGGINTGYTITGFGQYFTIVTAQYYPDCPTHPCVWP